MPHILITKRDNPSFSLYTTRFGHEAEHKVKNKNWIGFDKKGNETTYTNEPGVDHILLQNCSQEELLTSATNETIKYRLVNDKELTKITLFFSGLSKLKLEIESVLKNEPLELKAIPVEEYKSTATMSI